MPAVGTSWAPLPAAANGWKRDGLQLLVICQGQAVLHCLFQKFLTLVCAPDGTVTVDHKLGRKAMASADSSWRGRDRTSEFCPSAKQQDARHRPTLQLPGPSDGLCPERVTTA